MRKHSIIFSLTAQKDLDDIWMYISEDSENAATKIIRSIQDFCFSLLAFTPKIGRKREDLMGGIRSFPVGSYIIFYTIYEETILIVTIVHQSRDVSSFF